MSDDLIWVCFEPINYPVPRILHGGSDPNGDKDVYVSYVPADRIEELELELYEMNELYGAVKDGLEEKLATAMEALREIYCNGDAIGLNPQWVVNAAGKVLAELEGKND